MSAAVAPAREARLFQGVAKNEFGYKMLEKMGWSEGKGLGKDLDGITTHIKVKKKHNESGVGADTAFTTTDVLNKDWTANAATFDNLLQRLAKSYSGANLSAQGEEAKEAGGEEKKHKKKDKKESKKEKKAAKKKAEEEAAAKAAKAKASDGGGSSLGSEDEAPKSAKKVVTHHGRYKKRTAGKMTHAYSAEDMAAIMGGFAPPVIAEIKAEKPAESSGKSGYESDDSDSDADAKSKKKKKGEATPAKKKKKADEEKRLRKEEMEKKGVDIDQRQSFNEDDQEALYMKTLNNHAKASGKRGLGKADALKIEGGNWGGQKMKFGEGEGEEAEGSGGEEAVAAGREGGGGGGGDEHQHAALRVKWKKIITEVLTGAAGQKLKLKKFAKKALAAAGAAPEEGPARAAMHAALLERLESSSRFQLEAGVVSLAGEEAGGGKRKAADEGTGGGGNKGKKPKK